MSVFQKYKDPELERRKFSISTKKSSTDQSEDLKDSEYYANARKELESPGLAQTL